MFCSRVLRRLLVFYLFTDCTFVTTLDCIAVLHVYSHLQAALEMPNATETLERMRRVSPMKTNWSGGYGYKEMHVATGSESFGR